MHLIFAVPTADALPPEQAATGILVPGATRAILDLEETEAGRYLGRMVTGLQRGGLVATSAVVRGDPVASLVAEAERVQADLLVLVTHGRGGLGGLWAGSVGAQLLGRFRGPLLLIPVPAAMA